MKYRLRSAYEIAHDDKCSPHVRTLSQLALEGYSAEVVEHTIAGTFIKRDLWGADIIARKKGMPFLFVQVTVGKSNANARIKKCLANPDVHGVVECSGSFQIWSWTKKGPRGNRKTWGVYKTAITSLGIGFAV